MVPYVYRYISPPRSPYFFKSMNPFRGIFNSYAPFLIILVSSQICIESLLLQRSWSIKSFFFPTDYFIVLDIAWPHLKPIREDVRSLWLNSIPKGICYSMQCHMIGVRGQNITILRYKTNSCNFIIFVYFISFLLFCVIIINLFFFFLLNSTSQTETFKILFLKHLILLSFSFFLVG